MALFDGILTVFASENAGRVLLPHRAMWHTWRRRAPLPRLDEVNRILVVRLDEMGDVVMSSAFFRELRRNARHAHITAVTKPQCAELLAACPYINVVETFGADSWPTTARQRVRIRLMALRKNWRRTFGRPFDLILLPRRNPDQRDGEFLAFSSGFGLVAALEDRASSANRNGRYRRSFTEFRAPIDRPIHDVDYALALLEALGGTIQDRSLEAWTSSKDETEALGFWQRNFVCGRPFAIMHPSGGNSPLKQWQIHKFQTVKATLSAERGYQWLIIGGPNETWMNRMFPERTDPRVITSTGTLSLGTLSALLRRAQIYVGGDTGLTHLAAACGTPMVAVFGPTSEARFAPRGPQVRIVSLRLPCTPDNTGSFADRCQSCIYPETRCLSELDAESVLAVARELHAATAIAGAAPPND